MMHTPRLKSRSPLHGIDAVTLARAEAAIRRLSDNGETWLRLELDKLNAARECIRTDGYTADTAECMFSRALDLKGLGATCGYPIVTEIAGSLCRLIGDPTKRLSVPLFLLDAHISGIKAAVDGTLRDIDDANATALLDRLRGLLHEYEA
jgi:hypothetical protein